MANDADDDNDDDDDDDDVDDDGDDDGDDDSRKKKSRMGEEKMEISNEKER